MGQLELSMVIFIIKLLVITRGYLKSDHLKWRIARNLLISRSVSFFAAPMVVRRVIGPTTSPCQVEHISHGPGGLSVVSVDLDPVVKHACELRGKSWEKQPREHVFL